VRDELTCRAEPPRMCSLRSTTTTPYTPDLVAPRRKKTSSSEDALPFTEQEAAPAPSTPNSAASTSQFHPSTFDIPTADVNVDDILRRLEEVVRELESGELSLERALKRFEDGVKLARQGSSILDSVEQKVDILLSDRDEAVPFIAQDDSNS